MHGEGDGYEGMFLGTVVVGGKAEARVRRSSKRKMPRGKTLRKEGWAWCARGGGVAE